MKNSVLAVIACASCMSAWSADTPDASTTTPPTSDQVVAQFRRDLQAKSADVLAKGLTLTAEEAAKFWPLFEQYQKEQGVITEGQLKATQAYAKGYATLTDSQALEYVNALLARDQKIHDLRVKWLAKFQAVLSPMNAARAIQLERRLGLIGQISLSSQIPLVR